MKKLLIATTNSGKLQELSEFLSDVSVELVSLKGAGITDDFEENGKTYKENAEQKALFYAKKSNLPAIADDGGLEIDAFNGEPGIHSRRWLGYAASDEVLIEHMKKVAKELPDTNRKARFVTVVSFAMPSGKVWSAEGIVEGEIAKKPLLNFHKGYPYRSFFYLPGLKKYYFESELTPDEIKKYNHRWKAVNEIKTIVEKNLDLKEVR